VFCKRHGTCSMIDDIVGDPWLVGGAQAAFSDLDYRHGEETG